MKSAWVSGHEVDVVNMLDYGLCHVGLYMAYIEPEYAVLWSNRSCAVL